MKLFSFIVPAYNEEAVLGHLLTSIANLENSPHASLVEIIVVDAQSSDSTAEIAITKGCKVVKAAPGNVSASRNIGAAHASGDVLAFVDADCELPPDWMVKISAELESDSVVAAGAPMRAPYESGTWLEKAWYELAHKLPDRARTSNVRWLPTFNLAVKSECFSQTGGFDERLKTCEDVELGYQLAKHGTMKLLNESHVRHLGESKTVKDFFAREAWRSAGSLSLLARNKNWQNPRELLGAILPYAVLIGWIAGFISIAIGVSAFVSAESDFRKYLAAGAIIGILPVVFLTALRRVKWKYFIHCCFLLAVYFLARSAGSIRKIDRVARTS
jgi:glycosyltransferase involved in cell wall biosynthesis